MIRFLFLGRPELFDWGSLVKKASAIDRLEHAFNKAEQHLGIERLLDPEGNMLIHQHICSHASSCRGKYSKLVKAFRSCFLRRATVGRRGGHNRWIDAQNIPQKLRPPGISWSSVASTNSRLAAGA